MPEESKSESITISCPKTHEVESLSEWIPLAQTVIWVILIGVAIYWLKDQIKALVGAVEYRVRSGSSVKAGPIEIGEDLKVLERVRPSHTPAPESTNDWGQERNNIYTINSGIFLAHILSPSNAPGQLYDVFIFLVRHKSTNFDDIAHAEFFFGAYWGNKVYRETRKDGLIGISTTAYGPFLCTCRVTMKKGDVIRLHRYIDFEMGRVFQNER